MHEYTFRLLLNIIIIIYIYIIILYYLLLFFIFIFFIFIFASRDNNYVSRVKNSMLSLLSVIV